MAKGRIYWSGPRGFQLATRFNDLQIVSELESYGWEVLYYFIEATAEIRGRKGSLYGKSGLIRRVNLAAVERCDVLVAYVGCADTGTAVEMHHAWVKGIPILAWNDSFQISDGEWTGRTLETRDQDKILIERVAPMNSMIPFDIYLEFSDAENYPRGVPPAEVARKIDAAASQLLKKKL
jgi:nucleoside 2-deoxyribosyltransferase